MKKLFPLFVAILLYSVGLAQSREETTEYASSADDTKEVVKKQHRFGINIGGSKTLQEYSETDQYSEASGYADGGYSLFISYQNNFHEGISFSLLYGFTANKFNAQTFAEQLSRREPSVSWRVDADPYNVDHFMTGVKFFGGDVVKVYVNPLIGFGIMTSPKVDIIASDGNFSVSQEIRESEPSSSFIYGASFGIDFLVSDLVSINIDGTYLKSEFEIEQFLETFDAMGRPKVIRSEYDQPYEVFNFSLGIGLNF